MVGNEEIAPEIIAFHAQQAAEKALKALLIQRQVEFPRTHVIGVLLNLCQENGYTLEKNLEEAVLLSEYAVTARYPGEMSEVNHQEAKTAVDQANKVFDWVEKQIDEE